MSTSASVFHLAKRLENVGFSDIVQIRNKIMELRARGTRVFQFEGGEPFSNTPQYIRDAMKNALDENKTRYAPSSGIAELRVALSRKLLVRNNIDVEPENVIVLNGGMQGLFGAFQSVVNPGDEVLVFSPYWTPIRDLIAHCEGSPVLVPTDEARSNGFFETLERRLTANTRAIYFNTPANPSGTVISMAEAEQVARFARRNDLIVIADEAYEDLVYDEPHFSIASLPGMLERTITCYTFSKSYSMTGWRLGYAVAVEPWLTGLKKTLLYSTNGVSTPTQWAGLAAIEVSSDFLEESRAAYRLRRDLLLTGLNELGLTCEMPAGAFYAFPDVTRISKDSRKAAEILLERSQVSTVPGVVFGPHGEGHLRFSFSTSIETIENAIDSMRKNL